MNKKKYLSLLAIIIGVFLTTSIILGANESFRKCNELIMLENAKKELESKGQKVPEDLLRKIEFATEYSKISTKDVEKCEREVKEREQMLNESPKDKKGNPTLSNEFVPDEFEKPTPHPEEVIGIHKCNECGIGYFQPHSTEVEIYNFTTEAITTYDTLISGSRKDDKSIGVIYHISLQMGGKVQEELKEYPSKGNIEFESIKNANIITFTYDGEKKGYFDLKSNAAIFEEYRGS